MLQHLYNLQTSLKFSEGKIFLQLQNRWDKKAEEGLAKRATDKMLWVPILNSSAVSNHSHFLIFLQYNFLSLPLSICPFLSICLSALSRCLFPVAPPVPEHTHSSSALSLLPDKASCLSCHYKHFEWPSFMANEERHAVPNHTTLSSCPTDECHNSFWVR